jgi:hypothetical protein
MPEQTSWYAIEPGWIVRGSDGTIVGTVADVLGDEELDIFHGLVAFSWGGWREVPADLVKDIYRGQVQLRIRADDVGRLARSG